MYRALAVQPAKRLSKVGNKEFADYTDLRLPTLTRITNKHDPFPILPGQFLGFMTISRQGRDDSDVGCIVEEVSHLERVYSPYV